MDQEEKRNERGKIVKSQYQGKKSGALTPRVKSQYQGKKSGAPTLQLHTLGAKARQGRERKQKCGAAWL